MLSFCQIQSEEDLLSAVPPVERAARQAAEPAVAVAAMPPMRLSFRIHVQSVLMHPTPQGDPEVGQNHPKFQPSLKKLPARNHQQLWENNTSKKAIAAGFCKKKLCTMLSQPRGLEKSPSQMDWRNVEFCCGGPKFCGVRMIFSPLRSCHFQFLETNNRLDKMLPYFVLHSSQKATEEVCSHHKNTCIKIQTDNKSSMTFSRRN